MTNYGFYASKINTGSIQLNRTKCKKNTTWIRDSIKRRENPIWKKIALMIIYEQKNSIISMCWLGGSEHLSLALSWI